MRRPLEVLIVSAGRALGRGVRQLLEEEPGQFRCRVLTYAGLADSPIVNEPDIVLLAPESWAEVQRGLESLRPYPGLRLCLLHAEWCVAGMFASGFESRIGMVVSPGASPEELRTAVRMLANPNSFYRRGGLLSLIDRAVRAVLQHPERLGVSRREWECACAVALRLNNEEIAAALDIKRKTVESHVHHLLQKIPLKTRSRRELARVLNEALASVSPPFAWI